MNDTKLETLDQVRQFLEGTEAISFQIESKRSKGSDSNTAYLRKTSYILTVSQAWFRGLLSNG